MLPFMGSDSRYSLTAGEVHSLPLGRRVGVVSISPREVMIAFVGTDPAWTGGIAMSPGESVSRGGLTMTLQGVGKNLLGRAVAEFEVVQWPAAARSVSDPKQVRESPA